MKNAFEPPRNIYKLEQSKQQQSTEKASHCILVIQRREYGKRMLRQKSSVQERQNLTSKNNNSKAFSGEGHRLGTATETSKPSLEATNKLQDDTPEPMYDPSLTEEQREKIRADRAAAAEARLKKAAAKPVKKSKDSAPLRGPNSQPLMRWTAS